MPVIASSLGEVFGRFFNDLLPDCFLKKNGGIFKPEARLPTCYIRAFFTIPGLALVDQVLQHYLDWIAIVFGWGMFVSGVMVASVAVTTYVLDCYPNGSGEVAGFVNFARILSGFTVGYSCWVRCIVRYPSYHSRSCSSYFNVDLPIWRKPESMRRTAEVQRSGLTFERSFDSYQLVSTCGIANR